MTAPRPVAEILAERLSVVLAIGEANGARQRAQATASGALIELMTFDDHPEAGARAAALAQDDAAQARLAAAAAEIQALDDRLAALDRELAAAGG